ncbi:MAG: BatA and WFA domain-containing protein [Pirellulales bacterium]|nr:BatA and WFA domain-containing protein [Pirellulales bacterium]
MGLSWINMLSWWQWAILAAVPPAIVVLYFLKLKRRPVEVPSTYLWLRSIEDLHVNSIWQRLRKNLLLFLQLLLVALLIVALTSPGWRGQRLSGDRFIFLVDNSASMTADDVEPSRLDEAKRRAVQLIEAMQSGDAAMVISFADAARIEQDFTGNRRLLTRAVEGIQPTNRSTALGDALKMAAALANPGRSAYDITDTQVAEALPATIYLLSDGKFPDVTGFSLGNLTPVYVPIGEAKPANVGIVAFTIRALESRPEALQAFARLENFGADEVRVEAVLRHDGKLLNATTLELPGGQARGVAFDLGTINAGALALEIRPDDALAVDNTAWVAVNPPRQAEVLLITPGNRPLELGLSTEGAAKLAKLTVQPPSYLKTKAYATAADAGRYDLVIYDRCAPETMPQANTWFLGVVPPGGEWKAEATVDVPKIIDIDLAHPIMQWIALDDVILYEGTPLAPPPGGSVLVDSKMGPMLVVAPRQGFEDMVQGFLLVEDVDDQTYIRTTWPIRPSFPVFLFNLLAYFGGGPEVLAQGSLRPGQPVMLETQDPKKGLSVVAPDGKTSLLEQSRPGKYNFTDTDKLGVYEVRTGGKLQERFTVNLFDPAESDLAPRASFDVGPVEVAGQTGWEDVRRELWRWLVLAGLGVLLVEWYIYGHRVSL